MWLQPVSTLVLVFGTQPTRELLNAINQVRL